MHDVHTYHVEVQGQTDETAFNATSPLQVMVAKSDSTATLFRVHADQSGLIGLIRHLHHQGFTLLSIRREPRTTIEGGLSC